MRIGRTQGWFRLHFEHNSEAVGFHCSCGSDGAFGFVANSGRAQESGSCLEVGVATGAAVEDVVGHLANGHKFGAPGQNKEAEQQVMGIDTISLFHPSVRQGSLNKREVYQEFQPTYDIVAYIISSVRRSSVRSSNCADDHIGRSTRSSNALMTSSAGTVPRVVQTTGSMHPQPTLSNCLLCINTEPTTSA